MTQHTRFRFLKVGMFMAGLILFCGAASAHAATNVYVQQFLRTSNRDTKATTADWNTTYHLGALPLSWTLRSATWKSPLPSFVPTALGSSGSLVMIGGPHGALLEYNYSTLTTTNRSSITASMTTPITAIGTNGVFWLYGGTGQMVRSDGTNGTDVSASFAAVVGNYAVRSIIWNGYYWLITGDHGMIATYDGSVFYSLSGEIQTGNSINRAVSGDFNTGMWYIGSENGHIYTYNGSTGELASPFASAGAIYGMTRNGSATLFSGEIGGVPALYSFDHGIFTNLSSRLPSGVAAGDVVATRDGIFVTISTATNSRLYWLTTNNKTKIFQKISKLYFGATDTIPVMTAAGSGLVAARNHAGVGSLIFGPYHYTRSAVLQSKAVNRSTQNVSAVTITAMTNIPTGTAITFAVSKNGGRTWTNVIVGKKLSFKSITHDLRWRATLTTTNEFYAPSLSRIQLSYITQ